MFFVSGVDSLSISFGRYGCHYSSFCGCFFTMFCIVFCILNVIFIWVSLNNFVIFLVSFPLYVNVAHFGFCCCGSVLGGLGWRIQ
jgi:hypothetical protein